MTRYSVPDDLSQQIVATYKDGATLRKVCRTFSQHHLGIRRVRSILCRAGVAIRRTWSREKRAIDEALLRELWGKDWTLQQISDHMKIPRGTVCHRVRQLGLARRIPEQGIAPARMILTLYQTEGKSLTEIAKAIKRSTRVVVSVLKAYGVKRRPAHPVPRVPIERIMTFRDRLGWSFQTIANEVGLCIGTVTKRYRREIKRRGGAGHEQNHRGGSDARV